MHPDKNPADRDRAQIAFEAVNRAYKMLSDEKERKQCLEVVDEARVKVEEMVELETDFFKENNFLIESIVYKV